MIDTITYKECTIKIEQDTDAESPREWDNLGTMVCVDHRHYTLGDEQKDVEDIEEITKRNDVLWLPLYLYDHSGITMRTTAFHCPWDSGQVGIIYVTYERLRKEYSTTRITKKTKDIAYKVMKGEVETYAAYLEGNVVGFIAEGPDGEDIDSCWGFYPEEERGKRDYDYMLSQAEDSIDQWIEERSKQAEQVNQLI